MRSHLPRFATNTVAFFIAGALLAGCSSAVFSNATDSFVLSTDVGSVPVGVSLPAGNGLFKASYSGSWGAKTFGCGRYCMGFTLTWSGTGSARYLRASRETGTISFEFTEPAGPCLGGTGAATLTSLSHPQNSIVMALTMHRHLGGCNTDWQFAVKSGTGKFQAATGAGGVTFTEDHSYTDQLKGTLKY